MRSICLMLGCAAALASGACDENQPPPGGDEPVIVEVQDAVTGLPVAGIKVAVMDRRTNLPQASPLASDAQGSCDFGRLPGADLAVLAFGGAAWRVFGEPGLYVASGPGVTTRSADLTAPVLPPALVRVVAIPPTGGAHIAGTVVDSASGQPLAGAFLSLGRFLGGYGGGTTASDDVTLADGSFHVAGIRFFDQERPVQAVPLVVTCAGYLPRTWVYQAASGEDIGRIAGVTIRLQPVGTGTTGGLRGRVLRDGAPVPGLVVGLGAGDQWTKEAAGLPGRTAVCDQDGFFVCTDLPAGDYLVDPGYLPRDGAWYPDQPANVPRTVAPGAVTDAGNYRVLWEIAAEWPQDGAVATRALREFRWSPVPGAGAYAVTVDRGAPVVTTGPAWSLAPGDTLGPGGHVWQVYALGAADEAIGTFGAFAEFLVSE
ncbi:MAG: hypothetical protein ABR506_09280 [Candidatus Krumholzibacteriia bacterium]